MANFNIISAAYINKPPTEVGDYTLNVLNRASGTVLSLNMFSTDTTPPYSDPENDPVQAVRIDTLPTLGTLKLNGTNVTAGQIILATAITANQLTYDSPDQNAVANAVFTFSVRDSGSMTFVS